MSKKNWRRQEKKHRHYRDPYALPAKMRRAGPHKNKSKKRKSRRWNWREELEEGDW